MCAPALAPRKFTGAIRPLRGGDGDLENFRYKVYKLPGFIHLPQMANPRPM